MRRYLDKGGGGGGFIQSLKGCVRMSYRQKKMVTETALFKSQRSKKSNRYWSFGKLVYFAFPRL